LRTKNKKKESDKSYIYYLSKEGKKNKERRKTNREERAKNPRVLQKEKEMKKSVRQESKKN
jgi:hypothetical protein